MREDIFICHSNYRKTRYRSRLEIDAALRLVVTSLKTNLHMLMSNKQKQPLLDIYSVVIATFFCKPSLRNIKPSNETFQKAVFSVSRNWCLLLITRSRDHSSAAQNSFFHCTVVFVISVASQKSWQLYVD